MQAWRIGTFPTPTTRPEAVLSGVVHVGRQGVLRAEAGHDVAARGDRVGGAVGKGGAGVGSEEWVAAVPGSAVVVGTGEDRVRAVAVIGYIERDVERTRVAGVD